MVCGAERALWVPRNNTVMSEAEELAFPDFNPNKPPMPPLTYPYVYNPFNLQSLPPQNIRIDEKGTITLIGTVRDTSPYSNSYSQERYKQWEEIRTKHYKLIPGIIHVHIRRNGKLSMIVFRTEQEKLGFETANGGIIAKTLDEKEREDFQTLIKKGAREKFER